MKATALPANMPVKVLTVEAITLSFVEVALRQSNHLAAAKLRAANAFGFLTRIFTSRHGKAPFNRISQILFEFAAYRRR
jgi:hypothetical protein